jgi:hypothetical protein
MYKSSCVGTLYKLKQKTPYTASQIAKVGLLMESDAPKTVPKPPLQAKPKTTTVTKPITKPVKPEESDSPKLELDPRSKIPIPVRQGYLEKIFQQMKVLYPDDGKKAATEALVCTLEY